MIYEEAIFRMKSKVVIKRKIKLRSIAKLDLKLETIKILLVALIVNLSCTMKRILTYFAFILLLISAQKSKGQINTFPYFEDFDSGNGGWTSLSFDTLSNWQYGTPNFGVTSGAHSGNFCWDVNLSAAYNNNAYTELISPSFDFTGLNVPQISFFINYNTETSWDGTKMEYSTDGGLTWSPLGYFGDPNGINWYTNSSINALSWAGWDGNSLGWKNVKYKAFQCAGYNNVIFKFVFESDGVINRDGVSIDDFKVEDIQPHEVLLSSIITPDPSGTINYPLPTYSLEFRNIGSQNINTVNYDIILNGSVVFSGLFTGLVLPGAFNYIPISNTIIPQINNTLCARLTLAGETDTTDNFLCKNVIGIPKYEIKLTTINVVSNYVAPNSFSQPISMQVKNLGDSVLTGFTYGYKINGITANSSVYTGFLFPNDSVLLSLPGFNVTQDPTTVCAFVSALGDYDTTNNFACTIISWLQSFAVPFQDNFDGNDNGWYNVTLGFSSTNWELGSPNFGLTNSAFSAPNAWDVNLFTSYDNSANCILYSPILNFSGAVEPKLSFWQNRNSELGWDGMRVEYLDSTGIGWQLLGYYGDPYGTNWYNDSSLNSSNLPGWAGQSLGWIRCIYDLDHLSFNGLIQFRFVFTSDGSVVRDGISIDNFEISVKEDYDALITEVVEPNNTALQNVSAQVKVRLKNDGQLPITSLGIKYRLNGGPIVSFNWTGFLGSGDSTIVQLPNLIPIGGTNSLVVFIDWPADQNHYNDTLVYEFEAAYEYDAALDQIISPGQFVVQGINTQIKVALRNNGSIPLTNLTIKYVLNSNTPISYNWTGNLLNDSIAIVTIGSFIPPPGVNTLKVYSEWTLDTFYNNDTVSTFMLPVFPTNVPYTTEFENGNNSWSSNLNVGITNWELGTPTTLVPPATYSGSSCWDVNLAGNYFSNANISLTSPFFLVSQQGVLNLDFWLKYDSETGADLLWVENSTDGVTWNRLGGYNDPNGTNWYNTISGSNVGWSGNSSGWQNCQLNVYNPFGNNLMQFRFVFKSDGANNFEGFSLDDFTISVITSLAENNLSNNKIIVYPNPAKTALQVKIDQKYIGQNFNILNQLGQTVLAGAFNSELTALDISMLDAGIYVLKVGDAAIKFVKE